MTVNLVYHEGQNSVIGNEEHVEDVEDVGGRRRSRGRLGYGAEQIAVLAGQGGVQPRGCKFEK